jgi:acyl-coenzyme A synthetase/AMP-(fatty) acid ligase
LNTVGGVQECAVVAINGRNFESALICCAYVPSGRDVNPAMLRRELGRLVPSYMLPARWLAFDQFPKNANGKIDRRRLKEVFEEAQAPRASVNRATTSAMLTLGFEQLGLQAIHSWVQHSPLIHVIPVQ